MVSRPPDWQEIYESSLRHKYYGFPLWNPQPSSPANLVNIGDVGYVYKGDFYRIFNATKKDDKYCGNAKPLVINHDKDVIRAPWPQRPITPDEVFCKEHTSNTYTFETTKIRSAILIPLSTITEEYLKPAKEAEWKRYMARNLDDWPEPEVCSRRELRLVYGRVTAAKWLLVVFEMQSSGRTSWKFTVTIPEEANSAPTFKALEGDFSYPPYYRRGADALSLVPPEHGEVPKPPSHCVFLRVYQPTKSRGVLGWKVEDLLPRESRPEVPHTTKTQQKAMPMIATALAFLAVNRLRKRTQKPGDPVAASTSDVPV